MPRRRPMRFMPLTPLDAPLATSDAFLPPSRLPRRGEAAAMSPFIFDIYH